MSRTRKITHKEKSVFVMDFSHLNSSGEIAGVIEESASYIRNQPKSSLLTLTNLEGMRFNNEIRDMFNDFLKGNKPYIQRSSVIGLSGLQQILYNSLMKITGRDVRSFSSKDSALDWLVDEAN